MDINKAPKQFSEKISMGFSKEFFVLTMYTGERATPYVITPQHAKKLAQYISHQVSEFEKKFSEIDAKWDPNVKSPIQVSDLKKPPKDDDFT